MNQIKMPKILKYFLICYVGIVGVMMLTRSDMGEDIGWKLFYIISLSVYTALAAYGLISFLEDLRNGGLKSVIRKIRRFL